MMKKGISLLLTILAVIAAPVFAFGASEYPSQDLNYIIAFNPGGEQDVEFRIMQPYIEKAMQVRWLPNYMPSAGGALAWSTTAAAKPDGYTLGAFSIPHIILQPWFIEDVKFKTEDFTFLVVSEYTPTGLGVRKGFPSSTLKEFIEYAKANPGKVTVGIVGKFSGHHMAALQFMKMTGTKLTLIPYAGTGAQKPAIMGGHIDAVFASSTALMEIRDAGVKTLAIGTKARMKQMPDVPTFAEAGLQFYPRIDRGIFAPKGLSKEVASYLEKTLLDIVTSKEYREKITEAGFVPNPMGSAAIRKYIGEQSVLLKKLVEEEKLMQGR